jgi:hypothetical protein
LPRIPSSAVAEIEILVPERFNISRLLLASSRKLLARCRGRALEKTFESGINPICCAKVPNAEETEEEGMD